jgi:hypothetical protein
MNAMSSFCPGCGTSHVEGERFCAVCGRDFAATAIGPPVDPGVAFGLAPETSGKGIFSLISGLFVVPPFSLVAIIFGHLALSDIRRSAGRLQGRVLAILGLILGYGGTAATIVLIVLAITEVRHEQKLASHSKNLVPQVSTNQPTAVRVLRTLNTAEIAYAQAHPAAGYTCSLNDLSTAWGIAGDLAKGQRDGYQFALQGCSAAKKDGPVVKYQVVAYPAPASKTKLPAFCSNQSDDIRMDWAGSARSCLEKGVDFAENGSAH